MPTFIPDRLKTPGDFPSVDANDNQIRGFGFFDDNDARAALNENFRCTGYLAFMKDTDQFKQYNSRFVTDESWGDDANWFLLEGTTTDTYWSADGDGSGIYYSGQVVVGASTYSGDEDFYVSGTAKVTTSLETPAIKTSSGLDIVINTDETGTASDDFVVKYGVVGSGGTIRNVLDISPYATTPNIAFGNISDDFKLDHYSSSFSEFRTLSSNGNETGFKFTDAFGGDGSFLIRMKNDASYFEMKDGGRDLTVTPHFYKIKSTVEANSTVTHPVEMLMPSTATGDWTFNHLGNKNFVFNTNTGSSEKLITKFHAAGNGAVSIGTANYYNEYNGIQYPTTSAPPRLFILNDETSNVGIRVQSGDITLGAEGARTQPRYFTDMRDDGFYISRSTTGPAYDDSADAVEGEEWLDTGNPSAAIGMRRGPGGGNALALFARTNLYFFSNGTYSAFEVTGDPNSDQRDLKVWSPDNTQAFTLKVRNDDFGNGNIAFASDNIGEFLVAYGTENRVTSGAQILSSLVRGADFRVTSGENPAANVTPSLQVFSLPGKADNTGYWWGLDGVGYDTEADMLDAGTTLDTEKLADQLAIYVPKHGSGRVGIGTTSPRYGKLDVFGRIVSDAGNNTLPFFGYNMRNSDDVIVGMIGLGTAYNNVMVGGFNNGSVSIARHSSDGEFDDEIMGHFNSTGLGIGTTNPLTKLHAVDSSVNDAVLTLENKQSNQNWGGGLELKWAELGGSNPHSLEISSYNTGQQAMRFRFNGLSQRVLFEGAPGYEFDKEVMPGSGASDGGIASNYHQHLYFRLRSNNGTQGHDLTNMYFKAEGGEGTQNISGTIMTIGGNGNVGIGTSSPSAKLQVNGTLKSQFGIQNISGTDDMSVYNLTDNTGYIRLITTNNGAQREGLRVHNSGLTEVKQNLRFGLSSNASNSITVSRPIFTIGPADPGAETRIPTVAIGNGTYDANQFSISGSGSIFESNFLIGHTNYFGFRSPRSSGWIQTNPAKVLSVSVTDNVNGDVDTQFWATEGGTTTNHMTLHKDGRLSLAHKTSSVSIGKDAGLAVGDDMYNVSIGYQANLKDSLGLYNVYIGRDAGPVNYAQGETMTGEWVDLTKSTNSDVFVQGVSPEPSADYQVHDYNIGIGYQALKNNQSRQIIGIGYRAGAEYVHQFGVYTDVDTYSGNSSTDGGHIFIGNQAGLSLVRANVGVVAIGELALSSWVSGEGSIVAIGRNAMGPVTSTTRTTAIGNNALAMWSDGTLQASYSTVVGSSAAANLTRFNNSVAIGETCLNSAKNRYFVSSGGWNTADYGDNAFSWFDRSPEHIFDGGVAIGKGIGINSIIQGSILIGQAAAQNSRVGTGTVSIGAYSSQNGVNAASVVIGHEAERYNDNAVDAVSIGWEVAADKGQHFVPNSSEDYRLFNSKDGTEISKKFRLSWGFHDNDTVNYGETSSDDYYITPPFYTAQTGGTAIYQATGTQSSGTYGGVNFLTLGYFDHHIGFRNAKYLMFSSGRNISIGAQSLGGHAQGAKQLRTNVDWSSLITSANSGYTEGTYEFVRVYKRSLGKGRDKVKASVNDQSSTDLWIDEDHHYAQEIRMKVTVNSSGVITELIQPGTNDENGNYINKYGGQIHVDDELYIPADGIYSGSAEVVFKLTSSQTITDYISQVNYFGDDDSHLEMLGGGAGDNVAIGYQSLYRITGGHGNIALGSRSGNEIHHGSHNILIGSRAGFHLAGDDASGNVIIGSYLGTTNMSDKLVISQTGTSNVTTPLIEGTFTTGSELVKLNATTEVHIDATKTFKVTDDTTDFLYVDDTTTGALLTVNDDSGLATLISNSDGTLVLPKILTSAPSGTPTEGTIQLAIIGGTCYLYAYLNGAWKSTTLT